MEDIKAELEEMLDEAEWNWLQPHADRQALVVVGQELDLIEVGVAIASDNVQSVQHWLGEQLIYKPSPEQVANWNVNRSKRFNTLIVQPFVLVQELAAA